MASKHRRPRKPWLAPTAVAAGIGITAMTGAGIAQAAPESGWSNPSPTETAPESGWSNPNPTPTAPAPAPEQAPAPAPEPTPAPVQDDNRSYWTPPPAEYADVQWRQAPSNQQSYYDSGDGTSQTTYIEPTYVDPVQVTELHLPTAVAPVAPIEAPKERLRLGDFVTDQPNWMSDVYLDRTNNSAAVIEAQVNTAWQSIGVDAERSDRIAAATIAGAGVGALTGATAAAIPAATIGGLIGGTVGGGVGATVGGIIPTPIPGLPIVTTGAAGTAAGAAIGAAAVGVPAAAIGAVVGGIGGGIAGTAFGAGDSTGQPMEFELPNLAEPDESLLATQASDTVSQWDSQLPGSGEAVRDAAEAAPAVAEQATSQAVQAREAVLAQPGGDAVIGALDAAGVELGHAFGPTADLVNLAVHAASGGVTGAAAPAAPAPAPAPTA